MNYHLELKNIKIDLPNGKNLFSIHEYKLSFGSHLLIQGDSGQGKTTFLHLLAGLVKSKVGSLLVGEHDFLTMSENQICDFRRQNVGVIFQKLNLIDHLTVAENIQLANHEHVFGVQEINQVLGEMGLQGHQDQRVSSLSLGEQQRVAVARILAMRPKIILADEPTSSLDDKNALFVIKALKKIAQEKTLIVVSHDHRLAKHFNNVIQFTEIIR